MEVHVDVADLLDLEDPAGGDPAPRAQRVEPEVRAASFLAAVLRPCSNPLDRQYGQSSVQHQLSRARADVPDRRLVLTRRGTSQPDPRPGRRTRRARHRRQLPHRARPHRRQRRTRRAHVPVGDDRRVRRAGRRRHRHRHRRRHGAPRHAQRRRHRRLRLRRVHRDRRCAGSPSTTSLVVDADCRYSNTGEGLHRFVDPVDDEVYLYSQFETADAKRMFACFDQPDLKATFDVTVTAPAHWQVISNGADRDRRAAGDGERCTRSRPRRG